MKAPRVTVRRDLAGFWRWRVRAGNGRIIGASSEGYTRKKSALANGRQIAAILAAALALGGCAAVPARSPVLDCVAVVAASYADTSERIAAADWCAAHGWIPDDVRQREFFD